MCRKILPTTAPLGVVVKLLSHSVLYNIPRSKIERGIYYKSMIINKLATKPQASKPPTHQASDPQPSQTNPQTPGLVTMAVMPGIRCGWGCSVASRRTMPLLSTTGLTADTSAS